MHKLTKYISSNLELKKISGWNLIGEVIALAVVAACIHGLTLRFIFPGYYDPTMFEHADFYIPVSYYQGSESFLSMLGLGRPIGMAYAYAAGSLGTNGFIFTTLLIIFLNASILTIYIKNIFGIDNYAYILPFYSVYCFLLFSHPYFLTMAVHDALSQVSFLFIIIGFSLVIKRETDRSLGLIVFFILLLLAFLSKETFIFSVLILLCVIGYMRKHDGIMASLGPIITALIAFILATLDGLIAHSVFLSNSADLNGPYRQSYNLIVITKQFLGYIDAALPLGISLIFITLYGCLCSAHQSKLARILTVTLPVAGLSAVLPNSFLPNHFSAGYSWNTGYLFFAPILLAPIIICRLHSKIGLIMNALATCLIVFVAPIFWKPAYASNNWILEQADIQRNLRLSLDILTTPASLGSQPRRILVSGLVFPFSPFAHGAALREWIGHKDIHFDFVMYSSPSISGDNPVSFISPSQVNIENYTDIWVFYHDGIGHKITSIDGTRRISALDVKDAILYPEMQKALETQSFKIEEPPPPTAAQLMAAGAALLSYNAYDLAITFLQRSIDLEPSSYSYFYIAVAYEGVRRIGDAKKAAEMAVSLDNLLSPNFNFKQFLDRLNALPQLP